MVDLIKKKYSVRVGVEGIEEYLVLDSGGGGGCSEC